MVFPDLVARSVRVSRERQLASIRVLSNIAGCGQGPESLVQRVLAIAKLPGAAARSFFATRRLSRQLLISYGHTIPIQSPSQREVQSPDRFPRLNGFTGYQPLRVSRCGSYITTIDSNPSTSLLHLDIIAANPTVLEKILGTSHLPCFTREVPVGSDNLRIVCQGHLVPTRYEDQHPSWPVGHGRGSPRCRR